MFQINFSPFKETEIKQDVVMGNAVLESSNLAPNNVGKRQQNLLAVQPGGNDGSGKGNKERKVEHRDIERQRRQEMANLFRSMRSLLPLEYIKGKRSASDQMHEAVNYINHLKNNVKELEIKRDNLKKLSDSRSTTTATASSTGLRSSTNNVSVTVNQCHGGGVDVVLISSCGFGEEGGVPLSKVFGVLVEQGLEVVSYFSSDIDGRLFHTIRCEVSDHDLMYIDLFELQQKTSGMINGDRAESPVMT